jgi:hypothetical protein
MNKRNDALSAQKQGFIRTTNGFSSIEKADIIKEAYAPIIGSPGSKHTSIKYKLNSSFAGTEGREKAGMNITN